MAQDKPSRITRAVKEIARHVNVKAAARNADQIIDEEAPRDDPAAETDTRAELAALPSGDGGAPGVPCAFRLLQGAAVVGGAAAFVVLAGRAVLAGLADAHAMVADAVAAALDWVSA